MTYKIELNQQDLDMILDTIEFRRNHCITQAKKPLQSEKVSAEEKRKQWQYQADDLDKLASTIANQTI
jgi:hypothetical protein